MTAGFAIALPFIIIGSAGMAWFAWSLIEQRAREIVREEIERASAPFVQGGGSIQISPSTEELD